MSTHSELSRRLATLASFVPQGGPVLDVGTDHARLPVALVRSGRVPRAIASDLHPGPLRVAERSVAAQQLGEQIELRCADGLCAIESGEVDAVVVAGLGGAAIVGILQRGPLAGIKRLILQPQSNVPAVRRWLLSNGWSLVDEALLRERDRYYEVEVAEPPGEGTGPLEAHPSEVDLDLELGPVLRRAGGAEFAAFVTERKQKLHHALAAIERSGRGASDRAKLLRAKLELLCSA